jgi:hypothetical protein
MNTSQNKRATKSGLGREREDTLPGRSLGGEQEPRISSAELTLTRKLVWMTSAAGAAFALIAVVVFQLLISALRGNMVAVGSGPRLECIEGGEPTCTEGKVCRNYRCVDDVYKEPTRCEVGDACGGEDGCSCGAPLACVEGRCIAPAVGEDVCSRPAVITALKNLREKCAGDIDDCPPSDLKNYAIDNPEFDELMGKFPGTVTLHFPTGMPPLGKYDPPFPNPDQKQHYIKRLGPALPTLLEARHVFIISRSSAMGNSRRNDAYARERSKTTKTLILDALTAQTSTGLDVRQTMRAKFADFMLGPQKQLDAVLFKSRYANRAITWSEDSQRMLSGMIESAPPTPEDGVWLDRVINQVVFIVPVPCDLGTKEGD